MSYRRKNNIPCCTGYGQKCSDCGYIEKEFKEYREKNKKVKFIS